jgi:hypothetical protein
MKNIYYYIFGGLCGLVAAYVPSTLAYLVGVGQVLLIIYFKWKEEEKP